jgi:hypothetical protein
MLLEVQGGRMIASLAHQVDHLAVDPQGAVLAPAASLGDEVGEGEVQPARVERLAVHHRRQRRVGIDEQDAADSVASRDVS